MGILTQILQLILSLSILIILHEGGHFAFAKLFKTRVEKFYLFFNPWFSLFKFKKGDTEYGIGWLPLGGYVKISGMIDESMDLEQMKKPAEPWEFRSKTTWQRLLIMLGGVIVNFILAIFIYAMILFTWGENYIPAKNLTHGVFCDSLALDIGMQHGDKVLKVDTFNINELREASMHILLDEPKTITVDRDGEIKIIPIPQDFHQTVLKNNAIPLFVPNYPSVIDSVLPNNPAQRAGLMKNDTIIAINQNPSLSAYIFLKDIRTYKSQKVDFLVKRNGNEIVIPLTVSKEGLIGIYLKTDLDFFEVETINYSLLASFPAGVKKGVDMLGNYIHQFKIIFTKEGVKHVGGFDSIRKMFPQEWNWGAFWSFTAFLSIMLAFINVLPIPALDGGHVMFLLYEMITGKKPSDKFMEYAQTIGLVLVLALFVLANGNDVIKGIWGE